SGSLTVENSAGRISMATYEPKQERAKITRAKILLAARQEFADHGYEAASTRAIAARAGVHQPQINYHFESKDSLWRAVIDELYEMLSLQMPDQETFENAPVEALQNVVCALADFCVTHPELAAITAQVGTVDSPRLRWYVDEYVRPMFSPFAEAFERAAGLDPDPHRRLVLFYSLNGAATAAYTRAPAGILLTGVSPFDDEARALHHKVLMAIVEAVVKLFTEP
ncbi:MAG: TetR/AcrR family transcriptional regulator, partial [Acidimicrobiales bacterium]